MIEPAGIHAVDLLAFRTQVLPAPSAAPSGSSRNQPMILKFRFSLGMMVDMSPRRPARTQARRALCLLCLREARSGVFGPAMPLTTASMGIDLVVQPGRS